MRDQTTIKRKKVFQGRPSFPAAMKQILFKTRPRSFKGQSKSSLLTIIAAFTQAMEGKASVAEGNLGMLPET